MSDGQQQTSGRLAVLMFTDVVGSVELKNRLGVLKFARMLARHDELFRQLIAEFPSAEVLQDTGDGYFTAFQTVSDAVRVALRFQDAMHREPWDPEPLRTRIGIHLGELAHIISATGGPPKVVGMAADVAARLMSLARGGQILLTRAAFDEARQFISEYPATNGDPGKRALRWMAHGDYVFHGATEPIEVFEVGGDGIAPLSPPRDREKARRSVAQGKDEILGWRPAIGLAVPQTPAWLLEKKLGEGTFGEVWLARHAKLKQSRVFKFCFDADRLESFKRELTLFRLLRDALGDRPDITRLYDVCLDRPPFFLESEYASAGNLIDWAAGQNGLANIPLETRLEIVAGVCDAVAAAHSVGVLHKDIKPSNILIHVDKTGAPRPQLADFGIGLLTDHSQLAARHITEAGFTMMGPTAESSRTGTRIYTPPEAYRGAPFTMQGDIYALGVLLYQMTVADLDRPMALGWERGVADELLREDIAAAVDGDPERRINSAAEIANRLRHLPERREKRATQTRQREVARRRHRLLQIAAAVAGLFCVVSSLAVVGFFRERRLRVEAQTAYANGAVDQGVALHLVGRGQQSRAAFIRARDMFGRLGASPLPADVGLYRSFREFEAPINTIPADADGLMTVAWSPDGERVAAAGQNGNVRMWEARTGREIRSFPGHKGIVNAVAFSPDGTRLLSAGKDQTLRVWDAQTGELLNALLDPSKDVEIRGVAFSPDGNRIVSGAYGLGPRVRVWDLQSGKETATFTAPKEAYVYGVAFSPDGRRIAAATYKGDICVWAIDEPNRQPMRPAGHNGIVVSVAFSPDGTRILSSGFDMTIRLWDAATGSQLRLLQGHTAAVRGAVFVGADAKRVLSCSMDGTLRLWDAGTGETLRTFAGHTDGLRGLAVSGDGTRAASASIDDTVRIWSLEPSNEVPSVDDTAFVTTLAPSADGTMIASGNQAGVITLRDAATLRTLGRFEGHTRAIDAATLLGDGRRLFTADSAGQVIMFDAVTSKVLHTWPARISPPDESKTRDDWCHSCVAQDGSVAISSDDKRLVVWSPEAGGVLRTLEPQGNRITSLALTPDGKHALAGDMNGDTFYLDVTTGQTLFRTPHRDKTATIDTVEFSADGKLALAGGHDTFVTLWDLAAGRKMQTFSGHTFAVRAAGFGRGGATIYSTGGDQTLRMFDTATGTELELGARFPLPLYALAVIPPGDAVAAASGSMISVWDVSRAARHIEQEPPVLAAGPSLTTNAKDAAALLALGTWYAFRGIDDWATRTLEEARAAGANVSSLTLARCYWRSDRGADAAREFRRAIDRNEAPAVYLKLCLDAVADSPAAPAPTSRPAIATAPTR